MQNLLERELKERSRQSGLMRQYFDGKRAAFDARQEKFLRMYPYHGASCGADLRRFESSVKMASDVQRDAIIRHMKQNTIIGIRHMCWITAIVGFIFISLIR